MTEPKTDHRYPAWFHALVQNGLSRGQGRFFSHSVPLFLADGLLRDEQCRDAGLAQTRSTFSYEWQREDSYGSPTMIAFSRDWLEKRYASLWQHPAARLDGSAAPLTLDAGCGSANSAGILLESRFARLRYVGADHINFDWFTPTYAHGQSANDIRHWCEEIGLDIVDIREEEAGIAVVATRIAQ